MRVLISHKNTKREIIGPFNMCVLDRRHLEIIKKAIDTKLNDESFGGGWFEIQEELKPNSADDTFIFCKRQIDKANTPPQDWE